MAVLGHGFRRHAHADTIQADFHMDNPASGRVLEKCGFRAVGEAEGWSVAQNANTRLTLMELTRDDWSGALTALQARP